MNLMMKKISDPGGEKVISYSHKSERINDLGKKSLLNFPGIPYPRLVEVILRSKKAVWMPTKPKLQKQSVKGLTLLDQ